MNDPQPRKLDGWKAIADYLGRDERTALRWHKERGMPVHHVPGGKSGTVFALSDELDAWLTKPAPLRPSKPEAEPRAPVVADPGQAAQHAESAPASDSWQRSASRRVAWTLGTSLLTVVAVLVVQRFTPLSRAGAPERVEVREKRLVALDGSRAVVWAYDLTQDMRDRNSLTVLASSLSTGTQFKPIDFDGDGDDEIIAVVHFFNSGAGSGPNTISVVYCFTSGGQVLWQYSPKTTLTFADGRFDGPWQIRDWVAVSDRNGVSLWASFIHHTWWPSFVVSLDRAGHPKIQFVARGHVTSLATVQDAQGSWVFAAGVHNELSAAAVAVLDANGAPAVARTSSGAALQCDACPTGDPARLYVFARSELNKSTGSPINYPYSLVITDEGRIEVSVREVDTPPPPLRAIYRLSRFTVESVAMSDAYWETHRRFEREGKLTHSSETCPERLEGKVVKIWQRETGWKDVTAPQAFAPFGSAATR
jgi:hypothetical protein